MKKILTTVTIACLALCYSDVDAGREGLEKKSTNQKLQRSFSESNINKKVTAWSRNNVDAGRERLGKESTNQKLQRSFSELNINKKVTARSRNEEYLHIAVQRGQTAGVKRLIELGADINSRDKNGKTALMIFAEKGDLDMVKYLVKHGADDSEKALKIAKNKGYKEIADYLKISYSHPRDKNPGNEQVLNLLLAGKNAIPMDNRRIEQTMNDPYKNGKPIVYELLQHVREGNKEKINEFIKRWPTIRTNNIYAIGVLTLALDTKDVELIKYLLKNKINPNISDYKKKIALVFFAEEGDLGMVKYLVDKGANDIERALKIAEEKRYNEMSNYLQPLVESLLEQKNAIEALYNDLAIDKRTKKVTSEGLMAFANELMVKFPKVNTGIERVIETLWVAIEKGRLDILKYLIRNKINLEVRDYRNSTPLLRISKQIDKQINSWDIFKYLIDHGANPNKEDDSGDTPLHIAAREGRENIIKYLVEHGADINKENNFGGTALHEAAEDNQENAVKYLVEHGADINAQNDHEETALYYATSRGYENMVKYLVEHGADLNKGCESGDTALHIAAREGRENIIKYLVEHRADLNKRNKKGWTALHLVAQYVHENVVKYLVEHGADVNVEDIEGKTALGYADMRDDENMVKYLVEHGAKK